MIKYLLCLFLLLVSNTTFAHVQRYYCTSFVVNPDGYIATAAHCVKNKDRLYIKYNNETYIARLIEADYQHDVAIIKINARTPDFYTVQPVASIGEVVYVLGYPIPEIRGFDLKITRGFILDVDGSYYKENAGSCGGNSGGPVVNSHNQVVSVLTDGYGLCSAYSFSRKIEYVIYLAQKNNIMLYYSNNNAVLLKDSIFESGKNKVLFLIGDENE